MSQQLYEIVAARVGIEPLQFAKVLNEATIEICKQPIENLYLSEKTEQALIRANLLLIENIICISAKEMQNIMLISPTRALEIKNALLRFIMSALIVQPGIYASIEKTENEE